MRRTFISYAHNPPDREVALWLYDDLAKAGHFPWLDEKDLLPGEDWASRVVEEIRECKLFLALLSHHSLNRRGFVQKELRVALDVLDQVPVDERFLIPVRLDACEPRDERRRSCATWRGSSASRNAWKRGWSGQVELQGVATLGARDDPARSPAVAPSGIPA